MTKLTVWKTKIMRMINPYYDWNDEPAHAEVYDSTPDYDFSDIPNMTYSYYDLREFGYFIEGKNALNLFQLRNLTDCLEFLSGSNTSSYLEFGWKEIEIHPDFRRKGIMSFVMLNIIHRVLLQSFKSTIK